MLSAGISTGESKKMQGSESDNKPGAEKVIKKEEVKSSPSEATTPLLAGRPPEGAFHTRCIGCHEKEDKGPSEAECNACHSKD